MKDLPNATAQERPWDDLIDDLLLDVAGKRLSGAGFLAALREAEAPDELAESALDHAYAQWEREKTP